MKRNIYTILLSCLFIFLILFVVYSRHNNLLKRQEKSFSQDQLHKIKLTNASIKEIMDRLQDDIQIISDYNLREYRQGTRSKDYIQQLFDLYAKKQKGLVAGMYFFEQSKLKIAASIQQPLQHYAQNILKHNMTPPRSQSILPLIINEREQFVPLWQRLSKTHDFIVFLDLKVIALKYLVPLDESDEGTSFLIDKNGVIIFHKAKLSLAGKNITQGIDNPLLLEIFKESVLKEKNGAKKFPSSSYRDKTEKIDKILIWDTIELSNNPLILGLSLPAAISQENIAAYSFSQGIILVFLILVILILTYHLLLRHRRQRDKALVKLIQEEKERFELALQGSETGFWDWDIPQDRLIISENWKKNLLVPHPPSPISFQIWKDLIHPEDLPSMVDNLENHLKGSTDHYICEYRLKNKSGVYKWILDQGQALFDETGKAFRFVGHQTDITPLKLLEEKLRAKELRYRLTLSASQDGLWEWFCQSGEAYFSPHYYKMLGYRPQEFDSNFENWANLMHPDDREATLATVHQAVQNFEHFESVFRLRTKSDGWKWILARGKVVVWDEKGQPYKVMGTHTDYDKHKEIQQRLHEANQTKDRFFSIIAHDLKNPFNIFVLSLETLENQYDNISEPEKKEMIQSLTQSAYNTLNLLNNLLTWARSQSGKLQFQPDYFLINPIINENISLLDCQAREKNITLENNLQTRHTVFGDYNMVQTILRNLLTNAIKFTRNGGKVTVNAQETDKKSLRVAISDTGVGISPQRLKELFALDSNFSTRGTEQESGTGLGLILCREFVEKNYGEIWAESVVDQGSTFYFTLPLDPPAS